MNAVSTIREGKNYFSLQKKSGNVYIQNSQNLRTTFVDSMPLEICKMARHKRIKICKDDFQTAPDKSFCASQNTWFYGYKLHGVCTTSGVFQSIDITKASVHDVHLLKDLKYQMSDCVLLGDRGYLSATLQLDLFETANIKLETPMRINQIGYKNQPYIFRKSRKRIETLFSQLCDQFMIRRNSHEKRYHNNENDYLLAYSMCPLNIKLLTHEIMPNLFKVLKQEF